ncbi:zinc finger CCCH domain-containing protein 48-like isoform X2 [Diospyros lotus]|uniref:zinc finger CCCH domain-containing protein 48-like isoform X2 n=1 Tax=Diospyros lotus TaxID=55363 RepID=UPI00225B0DBF|nr:zinc finger CCCH domain-containing protein 48-like isoform X2 [Diospyros lotus]
MAPAVAQRISKRPPRPFRRGGPRNIVCTFWLEGRCTRHPCKFLHALPSESAPAAALASKQEQFQGRKSSRTWKRNPEEAKSGGAKINSSVEPERHDIKRVEDKKEVCQAWLSGNCMLGDQDCQYLHTWFYGSGFSLLAKLNGHSDTITGIALSSGSDKLYSGSRDKTVRIWDCHTGLCVDALEMSSEVLCLKSEGPWLFVGLKNALKAWNTQKSFEALTTLPTAPVIVGEVHAIEAMDNMLFAGTQGGIIFAWKFRCEDEIPELASSLKGHSHAVISLIIGAGMLYSGSMDNTIRVWDMNNLLCVQTLEGHTGAVLSVICWDHYLFSCSLDGTVKAWGMAKEDQFELEMLYSREEQEDGVLKLRGIQDADGKPILLCSCNDNSVRLYDLPLFPKRWLLFSKREVRAIETSSAAGLFFTGDATGQVTVWKLAAF